MSRSLADGPAIGSKQLSNRIAIAPLYMPCLNGPHGEVTRATVDHYAALAAGGPGLVIQEATCVLPTGKIGPRQLELSSDDQVEAHAAIAAAVHAARVPIVMQIHHAGVLACEDELVSASECSLERRVRPDSGRPDAGGRRLAHARALSESEVEDLIEAFVAAGRRAAAAGYDGVELHGCHGYLLCQFLNSRINRRDDAYADPLRVILPIMEGIRAEAPPGFLVGIRLAYAEPTLADGIAHARGLDAAGVDFIDVSSGFPGAFEPDVPAGWPYSDRAWGASRIKPVVSAPVFAVGGIRTPEQAQGVLDSAGVDMVDIGRSALVDPGWPATALAGGTPGACVHCKSCFWRFDPEGCPGRKRMERRGPKG
jgi:2,4-dienoyl-CoA reductase-like NADH-dependent reductase (Old Yellow Enzyme family)